MNNDLMQKLMISKAIMDKHNVMDRGQARNINPQSLQTFEPINASYNIPQEMVTESNVSKPVSVNVTNKDKIMSSKLPDEIKKLMIENPIVQPANQSPMITNEVAEAAAKLMRKNAAGQVIGNTNQRQTVSESQIDKSSLKEMMREVFSELLSESGLMVESTSKSNDTITFRVGQHLFEGKVTKVKKLK